MRIWIVTVGEPLVTDPGRPRLLRSALLCEELVKRGHEVTFWSSSFDHQSKKQRVHQTTQLRTSQDYELVLLRGCSYSKNISPQRFLNHRQVAREFKKQALLQARPDFILCSYPLIELCEQAVEFGNEKNIPVVLDLRDMWPDIFLDYVPKPLRKVFRPILSPLFNEARYSCANATALTGITPEFVEWGLTYAGRNQSKIDRSFWLAYPKKLPPESELANARDYWDTKGIQTKHEKIRICFFGTFSQKLEMEPVIEAVKRLSDHFELILCGDGELRSKYERLAQGCSSIVFPGWIDESKVRTLMERSDIGLAPYVSRKDFRISIPNKVIEYLSGGLPIVSCLQGSLQRFLDQNEAGWTYSNGNSEELEALLKKLQSSSLQTTGKRARAVFESEFASETVYSKMAEYIEEVASTAEKKTFNTDQRQRPEFEGRATL